MSISSDNLEYLNNIVKFDHNMNWQIADKMHILLAYMPAVMWIRFFPKTGSNFLPQTKGEILLNEYSRYF